ncbi:integrase, catalytic region, zinc finger, CCHC-type containing protein [Tanacetum coccineum]
MQDKKPDLSFFHVFGALCYPTNDNDDLGKLDAKADIGIFVGYAPAKKAFRIYNKRTQKIIETIHVTFDELTTMASKQLSSGPRLQCMTPATSNLGFVPVLQQPFQEAAAPRAAVLVDSPVSTSIDQDAPSTSTPSITEQSLKTTQEGIHRIGNWSNAFSCEVLARIRRISFVGYAVLVFSTLMAFGGNTRDLGSFGEETDEITDLHKILKEVLLTKRGDGVTSIKQRHRNPSSDGVRRFSDGVRT